MPSPTATPPAPAATPTTAPPVPTAARATTAASPPSAVDYPPLADPRAVAENPAAFIERRVSFGGLVQTVRVARPNEVYDIGGIRARALFQARLFEPGTDAGEVTVVVLYDGDTSALAEGRVVAVRATGKGQYDFPRSVGGTLTQPLFLAQQVEVVR